MQREFSKELAEDRDFEIGGELFKFRYPHWEQAAELWDESSPIEETGEDGEKNGSFSFRADTEFAIERIPIFLDPVNDSHTRFKALLARENDPVPRHQLVQLYRWLFQMASGLPTQPPSDSGSGGGDSASSSPGESS